MIFPQDKFSFYLKTLSKNEILLLNLNKIDFDVFDLTINKDL